MKFSATGLLLAALFACHDTAVAATATYTSAWAGGTIDPGDTAIINDGASITGNVVANGTLQFNQTSALTMSNTISGTGAVALTNTGTLTLTGLSSGTGSFDMAIRVSNGQFNIGSTGTNPLIVGNSGTGTLEVTGGQFTNRTGYLGYSAGSVGMATVSGGTWSNSTRLLYVGYGGSGTLEVAGGSVTNSNGVIGTIAGGVGAVTVSSGTWTNGGTLYVGGYVIATGGTGTLNVTGGRVTSVTSNIGFSVDSSGTVTVTGGTWSNSSSVFVGRSGTGTLNVVGGLVTSASGTIGTLAGSAGTATVSSGTWSNSGALVVGGGGTGTLTISGSGGTGGVVIVGGTLSKGGAGTINLNAGGTLQIGTGSSTGALGTDLVNNGALVFNRTGSSTVSSAIGGTGALTKLGAGTLTFSGTSSYSGATAINAGSFLVSGALGNSAVSVNAGGLLGGSGTISGSITANASGTLSPGAGIESLTTGAVTLLDQSTFAYEMNSAVPLAADLLSVTGNLSLSGTVGLTLTDLATTPSAFAAGTTFSLINYTGSWNSGLFSYGGSVLADGGMFTVGSQSWMIDYDASGGGVNFSGEYVPNSSFVNIAAVPEPTSWAMLVAGFACGGYSWWRRRASSAR